MAGTGGEPVFDVAGVEDEVCLGIAIDQLLVQQGAFREDVIA